VWCGCWCEVPEVKVKGLEANTNPTDRSGVPDGHTGVRHRNSEDSFVEPLTGRVEWRYEEREAHEAAERYGSYVV
jgi:hypothetical protein